MIKINNFINNSSNSELDSYSRELYNAFIKDEEVYNECVSLGISNEEIFDNIGFFEDIRQIRQKEKLIKTYQDCLKYNLFYKTLIVRTNYGFDKKYDAFDCYKEYLKYATCFIYKDFSYEFDDVEWKKLENKKAKAQIAQEMKKNKWIYLNGAIRSGRTYLAIALTNAHVKKHHEKVAFIDASKRFSELSNLFFNDREDYRNLMRQLINCELLVVDNFGSEAKNSVVRDSVVLPLFQQRANNQKQTIFTSSHTLLSIKKMYCLKNNEPANEIKAEELYEILKSQIDNEITVSNLSLY